MKPRKQRVVYFTTHKGLKMKKEAASAALLMVGGAGLGLLGAALLLKHLKK